jgi:Tol biopolymer transport system component
LFLKALLIKLFTLRKGCSLRFHNHRKLLSITLLLIFLVIIHFHCNRTKPEESPAFLIENARLLVKAVASNYIVVPRFGPDGREIIFNGRLEGDSWDCIYTIPTAGGAYQKLAEDTDDLLFPCYSPERNQIIYSKGLTRQIILLDLQTNQQTPLPIFGNTPLFVQDGNVVLYSGVMDANLRLYHIPTGKSKSFTESFISANFSPAILPGNHQLRWIERRKDGRHSIDFGELDGNSINSAYSLSEPISAITTSPSGKWLIACQTNGKLFGINPEDSLHATVALIDENGVEDTRRLFAQPCWSSNGRQLAFTSVPYSQFELQNPFSKSGYYVADLVIGQLSWQKIDDPDIFRAPAPRQINLFPSESSVQASVPESQPSATNNPPQIISDPQETVLAGDVYLYRIQSVDIDLFDHLSYILLDGPLDAELLPESGILYWVASDIGKFDFEVEVSDDAGANDRQSFTVEVIPSPNWSDLQVVKNPQPPPNKGEFIAGMKFKDGDDDGFLSNGEEGQLLIDLKCRSAVMDSVRLQLITTATNEEIELANELVFDHCTTDQWSRKIVPIKGLEGLRNRPIVIRGLIQTANGLDVLPASLLISAKNTAAPPD